MSPISDLVHPSKFGYILSLAGKKYHKKRLQEGFYWCLDNGVFANKYDKGKFLAIQERFHQFRSNCKFVVMPDVVGNYKKTLNRFNSERDSILDGYKVAFVTQDGININEIPFDDIDCLFIGGSDYHKLKESWKLINEALERKKWVHVGRVNSAKRIKLFWMVDSVDGSTLARNKSPNNQRLLLNAVAYCNTLKSMKRLI